MRTIIDIFEEKARKSPHDVALYYDESTVTYGQLSTYTNNLADYLIHTYNVKEGTTIPILCKPSIERLLAIFTIFKMGCSYLPISTESPRSRQCMYIEASHSDIVLSDREDDFSYAKLINIAKCDYKKKHSKIINRKTKIAYRLYTSGSTGKPKGVVVTHDNLLYILENMQKYYPVSKGDKYLLGTPYTFDVSVTEILGWIMGEGALIISNFETKNAIREIQHVIAKHHITHMALSPSVLGLLLKTTSEKEYTTMNKHLKYLMIAGEEFPTTLGDKVLTLLPDVVVANLYGPTETTVYATHHIITKEDVSKNSIPIGRELDEAKIYIIDEKHEIVQDGVKGEILISGRCVTEGYFDNKQLTEQKFIEIDVPDNKRKIRGYKSGDLALRDKNHNIIFHGRKDNQIQLNGIRVELGEIENILLNHKAITQAVIIYHNNLLYAFYSTADAQVTKEKLKAYVVNKLPKYMHPKIFCKLDKIPINMNGKADRRALIDIINEMGEKAHIQGIGLENLTVEEQKIRDIVQKILGKSIISKKDNIMELGIDSLIALEIELAIEKILNVHMEAGFLYNYSSIEEIARYKKNLELDEVLGDSNEQWDKDTIESNKQGIKNAISDNEKLCNYQDVDLIYEAFAHQKRFIHYGFDSYITVTIPVSKSMINMNKDQFQKKLVGFLNHFDMFRSWLDYDENDRLTFYTLKKLKNFNIPFIISENIYKGIYKKEDELIEFTIDCLKKNRLNNLPFQIFVMEDKHKYSINFVMDHCVSDYASRHIIKRNLLKYLKKGEIDITDTYYDYVQYIKNKNDDIDIKDFLNHVEEGNTIKDRKQKFNQLKPKLKILKINRQNKKLVNKDIIRDVVYQVGLITSNYFEKERLTQRIIINLRDFDDRNFENVVGDCHACTYFVFNQKEKKDVYNKRFERFMEEYHYEKALNFNYIANQDFVNPDEEEKKARKILFGDFPVDINFLGQLRENELYDFFSSSIEATKTIANFGFEMVLAVAAICNNQLYIGFMCNVEINPYHLEALNAVEIDIEDLTIDSANKTIH